MSDDALSSGNFDINGPGIKNNLFGLPCSAENSNIIIVPVPWEVTVSYKTGTSDGPQAILKASTQIDLFNKEIRNIWEMAVSMLPIPENIREESTTQRKHAEKLIESLEEGNNVESNQILLEKVNEACETLNVYIKNICSGLLKEGKVVGVLGGDHSTPLGLLRALSDQYDRFGILQIDAHADLRRAYEGFRYSHGSIMYNALKLPSAYKIIQVGIRDFCEEEYQLIQRARGRIKTFYDVDIKRSLYEGKTWSALCDKIINELPPFIYISFDIDGLDPKLCPNTGTPVPGGYELEQIIYLIKAIVKSGKKIIGFDLCEVAPGTNEWDANVGARTLWELCSWTAVSQGYLGMN